MGRSTSTDSSRRRLMTALTLAPVVGASLPKNSLAAAPGAQISSAEARKRLIDGNARYVAGQPVRTDYTSRRAAVVPAQMPFAVVLGCADSRVPPEIVFDQGLGDLFTVRVAGNITDDLGLGSIEYAVEYFATPLIVVLGHERCGAVSAAVEAAASGHMPPPHIGSIVAALRPAVEASRGMQGDAVENAVRMNVRRTVDALKRSRSVLAAAVEAGRLEIVGAEYRLASGRVAFFG